CHVAYSAASGFFCGFIAEILSRILIFTLCAQEFWKGYSTCSVCFSSVNLSILCPFLWYSGKCRAIYLEGESLQLFRIMTDQEFVVLDELYFVQSFNELIKETSIQQETLRDLLQKMIDKGWIRCLRSREDDDA